MQLTKVLLGIVAGATLMMAALPAKAAQVNDTSLVSPGVYFGAGNGGTNVHWATNTQSTVELGLTVIQRGVGATVTPTGNVYNVPTGADSNNAARAWWNYNFSVNTRSTGLGTSTLTLADIITTVTITNVGTGQSISFNPMLSFLDNSAYAANGTTRNGNVFGQQATPLDVGFQNSENMVFFPGLSYNMNANATFDISLAATNLLGTTSYGDVDIRVVVGKGAAAPVPGPLVGAGIPGLVAACAGLLALARRRKKEAAAA